MFGSIVVGTDGSDTAKEAVRQAVELAKSVGAELLVVSAFATHDRRRGASVLAAARASTRRRTPGVRRFRRFPRQGDPADAILDVAEERDADLIVVGNKGMTGAKRFLLGSVPNKVSHHAPCSVLIIRTT